MKEQKILLFDREVRYREKLTEYARSRQQSLSFEFQVFTREDLLLAGLEKQKHVLCLAAGADLTEELVNAAGERMILLDDGKNAELASRAPLKVKKYQKAGRILSELEDISREMFPVVVYVSSGKSEITGVYSPIGRCGKTSFALMYAKNMAKKGKTLFICLDEFSFLFHLARDSPEDSEASAFHAGGERTLPATGKLAFRRITEEMPEREDAGPDLGDLVCALDTGEELFCRMFRRSVVRIGGFDFVLPVHNARELKVIRADEWERLLDAILKAEEYAYVVLDIGSLLPEVLSLLDRCSKIYMPVLKEKVAEQKVSDWESFSRQIGREDLILRSERLFLPRPAESEWENYFQTQEVSEFGDYVRRIAGG